LKDEEKVPCQTDAVIFEPISTFMVQGLAAVKQIDVAQQVKITKFTLRINNLKFTENRLRRLFFRLQAEHSIWRVPVSGF
jgi:hypothetical protein